MLQKIILACLVVGGTFLLFALLNTNFGFIGRPSSASTVVTATDGTCGLTGAGCGGCGGGKTIPLDSTPTKPNVQEDIQVLTTIYTQNSYLQPNSFTVKSGQSVKLVIDVKDDGNGCGSAILIPGLYNTPEQLVAGQTISMNFTPTTPGTYTITCGMNMIQFGTIIVE